MVSSCRNNGTISQELRYPFTGTVVQFWQESSEDEKFQRRIDYLRENADQVIRQLGCTEYIGYKVIPYMCMNKVLVSRYKKVAFPIVSYPELVEIISDVTRE